MTEDVNGNTESLSPARLIEYLGVPHRRRKAVHKLLAMGFDVIPHALLGMKHDNSDVRRGCCELLDHYLVPSALAPLIAALDDEDAGVRRMALHTLACDRCKEGDCRPEERQVLPRVIRTLEEDPSPHARAMAIEVIGNYVHTSKAAEAALLKAVTADPSPAVRKKAGWYAPGGTIYKKTEPRQ